VSGLHKPGELGRWNQGDVARASPSDNDRLLLIYHLVEHASEILAETGIRRFTRHGILNFIVQYSCTCLGSPMPQWTDLFRHRAERFRPRAPTTCGGNPLGDSRSVRVDDDRPALRCEPRRWSEGLFSTGMPRCKRLCERSLKNAGPVRDAGSQHHGYVQISARLHGEPEEDYW
jgi:hypothetical protein